MTANLFSSLERFCEESQVMAGHWSIALNDESSVTHSVSYLCRYRAARLAKKKGKSRVFGPKIPAFCGIFLSRIGGTPPPSRKKTAK